ncbi:MAG TPA: hypothetical protein VK663_02000 [Burkholderiales bacterium]|nr:hypothetical protein [Burkholderiales bacterium]
MPYVIRDAEGKIVQLFDVPVTGAAEHIASDSKEMEEYEKNHTVNTIEALRRQLAETDGGMARLVEDMIDVLIAKKAIKFTDLPAAAGVKYLERLSARERMRAVKSIVVDAHDII